MGIAKFDLLVVGGGINGAGIARDAAGRGLTVLLVERDDLGGATSSASSKLIHGGLRYLEQFRFRLVREALAEREVLLQIAPHLVHPMRFVMPYVRGLRPAWLVRAGLLLYDHLARRDTLPASRAADLDADFCGAGLKASFRRGFEYSDCWVDDARLVIANVRDAADRGCDVRTRCTCMELRRVAGEWRAALRDRAGDVTDVAARAVVNATGPWVKKFLGTVAREPVPFDLRLVQGSHIIVPRLYDGNHAYILQNDDRRVVFAYRYEEDYTLIGTTEVPLDREPAACRAGADEIDYLCRAMNRYFQRPTAPQDVAYAYCGIRPLFDDGAGDPSEVTRDYVLRLGGAPGEPPLLSVLGGKITTYRRLAERALERLAPWFAPLAPAWTASVPLPGGRVGGAGLAEYVAGPLQRAFTWVPAPLLAALARRHGTLAEEVLRGAGGLSELGQHFGAGLYAREIDYFRRREWASTAEDVLWRRTKAGLHLDGAQRAAVERYVERPAVR